MSIFRKSFHTANIKIDARQIDENNNIIYVNMSSFVSSSLKCLLLYYLNFPESQVFLYMFRIRSGIQLPQGFQYVCVRDKNHIHIFGCLLLPASCLGI